MSAEGKKVWAVSSGEYSSYGVHFVCATEELADRIVAHANRSSSMADRYYVEELPYFDSDPERVTTLTLEAELHADGTEEGPFERTNWDWKFSMSQWDDVPVRWTWTPIGTAERGRLRVWGTDAERVRKVYGEQRAALLTDDAYRSFWREG